MILLLEITSNAEKRLSREHVITTRRWL